MATSDQAWQSHRRLPFSRVRAYGRQIRLSFLAKVSLQRFQRVARTAGDSHLVLTTLCGEATPL
jgi:hypothetical protein